MSPTHPAAPPPAPPGPPAAPRPAQFPVPATPSSGLAVAAFVLGLLGFLLGIVPFVGFVGTIGLALGIADRVRKDLPERPRRHGIGVAGIVLGSFATLGAGLWVYIFVALSSPGQTGSCPHVYAHDGQAWQLDADPVSGALYAGAERDDLDRLEHLRAVDGQYRVRIADDLQETDHIDDLTLFVVDHAAADEILPTQDGDIVALREARSPLGATDERGRDVRPLLAAEDGRLIGTESRRPGDADVRARWTLRFARPSSDRAVLVVRGHNTPFAEEALVQYLATMGSGLRPLLEWTSEQVGRECYGDYMDEELERLGLPLRVRVAAGGAWVDAPTLQPVGPAISRSQALPLRLPPGGDEVTVRLEATPRFWEIDQVQLAVPSDVQPTPRRVRPRRAVASSGRDVTATLAARDGRHVVLRPGERVDLQFDAPPAVAGRERTVLAGLRGYYAMDIGGQPAVDPATLLAHRLGWRSLPRFAAALATSSRAAAP